jgi:hypothetical protein
VVEEVRRFEAGPKEERGQRLAGKQVKTIVEFCSMTAAERLIAGSRRQDQDPTRYEAIPDCGQQRSRTLDPFEPTVQNTSGQTRTSRL